MYDESEYYNSMIELGVKGFVLKDMDNDELYDAIRKVNAEAHISPRNCCSPSSKRKPPENKIIFTRREKEILDLICKGFSNQQISDKLSSASEP